MAELQNSFAYCRNLLLARLKEPAPARIQLLTGPRQVGKTTLLLDINAQLGDGAVYAAGDDPDAALPGFWERQWAEAEARAARGPAILLLDEVHHLSDWAARLKGHWDRARRRHIPIHVVATGSSALRVATGLGIADGCRCGTQRIRHIASKVDVEQAYAVGKGFKP